jgi:hypothetical protein
VRLWPWECSRWRSGRPRTKAHSTVCLKEGKAALYRVAGNSVLDGM